MFTAALFSEFPLMFSADSQQRTYVKVQMFTVVTLDLLWRVFCQILCHVSCHGWSKLAHV